MIGRRQFMVVSALGVAGMAAACSRSQEPPRGSAAPNLTLAAGETEIDLDGATLRTWAYGNRVPAQEIRLRKGERLRAALTNAMPQDVTVHWHGIAIVNDMDGVPVLTQTAVPNGQTFTYDFVVPDAGTYWFHSHVGTQLDRGLYGPLIVEDPDEKVDYDGELVVVLDDWIDGTGTNPDQVFENLRKTGMKPMEPGGPGVTPTSPLGADGGDVTYPYFIINGRGPGDPQVVDYRTGQRIRLRVINAGSDTAFRVAVPGTTMRVIQTDGYPVVPVEADSVILGMGERVDAIITVNESLPVVGVPEGKQGHARLTIRVNHAPAAVNVDEFVASVRTMAPLNTATLSPTPEVTLPAKPPDQVIDAHLAGPVHGYTWPINEKLYHPPHDGVVVQPDQRVRIRYINDSMMFHPFHLHGHTFQVMDGDTPKARKDTVLVPPKQTVVVDFDTNNPGRWITHCHNTYHLEAGMATFLEYAG
ncbi:putative multicopper oxidase [Mycolicibacterium rhodesiae NBB3]|uniref:Putative multicopper oxidase n=1 Tax=Mycolicibacterium rhodesiae (strain NBB3) TaxID=710685 RepID=G8RL08_MYCRN|nr:multicopper oxidase family protein [Mycolicibacterium rhodesiae]AEV71070.1 putative multicopper oxidase [Mycolicibacterium rhodesiae NBB3]